MKKTKLTRILLTAVAASLFVTSAAYAAPAQKTITVDSGVKIYSDNKEFIPQNANGNTVEPFVYEGATYLPASVSESVWKEH